ncbi:MAG: hypothetical protein RLZZ458_964 [Planctomycetota bacterium]
MLGQMLRLRIRGCDVLLEIRVFRVIRGQKTIVFLPQSRKVARRLQVMIYSQPCAFARSCWFRHV